MDVAGIGYGATILPISIDVNNNGQILVSSEIMRNAINYAVENGANIINCSWQYQNNDVIMAIQNALNNNCIVVFAAGNNGSEISSPANCDNRIIVAGSIDIYGNRSSFSNYGPELDVVAPGENVYSLFPGNSIIMNSGTSFSAPQVSGLAAMILSKYPDSSPSDVKYRIFKTASKIKSNKYKYTYRYSDSFSTWNEQMGYGLIDAYASLSPNLPYLLTIKIRNSANNKTKGAFRIDFYDSNYNLINNLELTNLTCTLLTVEEYIFKCNLLPGTYIANPICETDDGIETDFEFNFTKGGILSFEYTGVIDGKTQWEKPD